MTRQELLDLYTPIYDEFAMFAFAEHKQQHQRIFDVVFDATKDYKYNSISGLGEWEAADEDSEDGLDHFVIGYEGTAAQLKYRKYFYVTFAANQQNEYADLKKKIAQAEALGRGARARIGRTTFSILYDGFSTAGTDGLYLWHDSHYKNPEETGTTYDNLLSGPFSHDNLELAESQIASNYFDMDGIPIQPAEKPVIVHAPALDGAVERVLTERGENERPGTQNRDKNVYAGKYDHVSDIYLSATMGGSDTAWYIIYPSMKMLRLVWAQKPQFASWIDNLRHRYYFDGWMWCVAAATDWRCGFASTGL